MSDINVGDDVTINGRVEATSEIGELLAVKVRLKSGDCIVIGEEDVNTVRPLIKKSEDDKRRGD